MNNTVSTVSIFPNPTTGKLNLQWNVKTTEKGIVTVSDMAGKALYQTNVDLSTGSGCTQLDLSSIANGMYLVNIKSASINYNAKVLVNKQ